MPTRRKDIAAITFGLGSEKPFENAKASDVLCRRAENTCLCENCTKQSVVSV